MDIKFLKIPTKKGRVPDCPYFATKGSAGADLTANIDEDITVPPLGRVLIPTGLAMQMPDCNYGAFVFARSGLSIKHGLALSNGVGVIDSDYRGQISVGLVNLSPQAYTIHSGERIAQLVIMPVEQFNASFVQELDSTERGNGGFGSTGR